ncbi:MAG TPA: TetR/AcrR family transcriptional regulator [Micromonosporaceae bacterium]
MTVPNRRERLRKATVTEIKAHARRLLVAGGPQAISLRAIARDMGMTAPAIYRYFPGLDALVAELTGDLYDEMRELVTQARDAAGEEPLPRLAAMTRAFRSWSVTHPAEFTLLFGAPLPGVAGFVEQCTHADHPGARFGALFLQILTELWHHSPWPVPPTQTLRERLGDTLAPLRQSQGPLPVEVAYTFLSGWVRLYGLVAQEVFGHLRWAVTDPEALFSIEVDRFLKQLTADAPPTHH